MKISENYFPRLLVLVACSVMGAVSCSSDKSPDAGECAVLFLENCLSGDMDSAKRYCSSDLYREVDAALENSADSSVLAIYRDMVEATRISVSAVEKAGEDSVIVSLDAAGHGKEYVCRFMAVRENEGWLITDIL